MSKNQAKSSNNKSVISPTRNENFPDWYQQVIKRAELAENSPTRGCMVIKPWGFGLWENVQKDLDRRFKETGHENAYFPLLIPLELINREAQHVDGFAKECAVVTHHRLEKDKDGNLEPAGKLEEPYIIRPTSEAIIGEVYSGWVQSHRDLPIKLNQWCNVMRWEMRTRLFLRTAEFLWQEGHTAHADADEARAETDQMLNVYNDFCHNVLAMPVIMGEKTPEERFPGAEHTYTIEGMMQDTKALQCGTSHYMGQNFAKAYNISFTNKDNEVEHAYTTSWGVSTRLIGGLIMTHSDDDGLVLPPKIATRQVIIIPVIPNDQDHDTVMDYCSKLKETLSQLTYDGEAVRVELDKRDLRGGDKFWQAVAKGYPIRIEVGPRDIPDKKCVVTMRHKEHKDKAFMEIDAVVAQLPDMLQDVQDTLYKRAQDYLNSNTHSVDSLDDLKAHFSKSETPGFVHAFSSVDSEDAEEIEAICKDLKITRRCVPLATFDEAGTCIFTGKDNAQKVVFAQAY